MRPESLGTTHRDDGQGPFTCPLTAAASTTRRRKLCGAMTCHTASGIDTVLVECVMFSLSRQVHSLSVCCRRGDITGETPLRIVSSLLSWDTSDDTVTLDRLPPSRGKQSPLIQRFAVQFAFGVGRHVWNGSHK